jgi:hypothetical protein
MTESVFPAKSPYRNRQKRCYELAARMLGRLNKRGKADGVTLVHGTVAFSGTPIGHALLESGTEAYDAVRHETLPIDQYVAKYQADAGRRYTYQDTLRMVQTEGHYGPWHNIYERAAGKK